MQAATKPTIPPPAPRRQHRTLVTVFLTIAAITGLLSVFAVWTNRQVLNTDNWTNTSARLLANPKVQTAVGTYMVDQLFQNVNVAAELQTILPPQAQSLAGPAAGGLQQVAEQAAPKLLARPRVQGAWELANRAAHQQLLQILNGGSTAASTNNGEVTLNIRPLVDQLAASLGISQQQVNAARAQVQGSKGQQARAQVQQKLGVTLPKSSGQIVILRSNQLKAAQDIAKLIRHLAIVLPAITFALFAAAVALAAGWRRVTLRAVGWCFAAVGLLALIVRRVAGNAIVDSLVKANTNRPAAHEVWQIGTSLLYDIAVTVLIFGLILVAAAWLAGGTRPAVAARRVLAPAFRDHLTATYGVVALLFLLLLAWGPVPATRQLVGIVLLAALIALGVEVLRRQTAREFPPRAAPREGDAPLPTG
jgi:hypothetical protein